MRSRVLPLCVLGLLLVSSANATIMLPLSVEEMTKEASAVVRGKVKDRSSEWDANRQRIYTVTTLEVTETIHATMSIPKEIQVRTLGGEKDGVGMKVAGSPQFLMGEDVVVFLKSEGSRFQVIGMAQGKYQLQQDAGRIVAVPNLDGIAFAGAGQDGVMRAGLADARVAPIGFVQLRQQIQAAAAKLAPGK